MLRPIRVVVVEDHEVTRRGVKELLSAEPGIEVIAETGSMDEAILLVGTIQPDVVILDIKLGPGSGIDVANAARTQAPNTKVLVFSAYDEDQYVAAFMRLGARGYLLKSVAHQQFLQAVRDIAQGMLIFDESISDKVLRLFTKGKLRWRPVHYESGTLSAREGEILQLICGGFKNREIAETIGISVKTVEAHVEQVFHKLGVRSRTEAVLAALESNGVAYESGSLR